MIYIFFYFEVVILLGIVLLFHFFIGKYPERLVKIRSAKKELLDVLVVWSVLFCIISYLFLSEFYFPFLYYPVITLFGPIELDPILILSFILPFIFVRFWSKRSEITNLGFKWPKGWIAMSLFLIIMIIFNIFDFLLGGGTPQPLIWLIWGVITPAFNEEIVSRGVFTSKLERAFGINKGWILSGVLFGLLHIPNDFFGDFWYIYGRNLINSFGLLINQVVTGWILGIVFIKTRSLLIPISIHYISDYLPAILQTILSAL